jgi:Zc3h12a-like ribonuclease protein
MVVSVFILLVSGALVVWSTTAIGPVLSVPMLVGLLGIVFGGLLLGLALIRSRRRWIVVDGSNVLYWQNEKPSLYTVRVVVDELIAAGLRPVIWFDANVGYLVADRYLGPRPLARELGLSPRQVRVAPKGTPADPLLIAGADHLRARIVTNDRFRDWAESYPLVTDPARFVRGQVRNGVPDLEVFEHQQG